MIRISIMIVILWGIEVGLIVHSSNKNEPMPAYWIYSTTLINTLITIYLIASEILVLHGK